MDKIDEVLMQLESIKSARRERQKLKPKCKAVKVSKKPANRLSMYGFPKMNSKPVQKFFQPVQQRNKEQQIVSFVIHFFSNHIYFKAFKKFKLHILWREICI